MNLVVGSASSSQRKDMGESKRVYESEVVVPIERLKEMMVAVLNISVSMGISRAKNSSRKWK